MVRPNVTREVVTGEVVYVEYAGEHTDTKPTKFGTRIVVVNGQQTEKDVAISTGSLFVEVDTKTVYAWSESESEWKEFCTFGGSGD